MKFVNDLMSAGCGKLGILLSRRPDYFILLPVFLTAVLASYLQHLDYNRDLFLLFTPQNGRAMKDRAYVEHLFGSAANHDMSRSLGLPLLCAAILVCKDSKSILRPEFFNEVRRVDSGVENLTGTYHGRSYSYPELCDKNPTGECIKVNSVLDLNDGRLARVNSGHSDIKYPLRLELEELIIETMGFQMGGVQLDQNGNVLSAESIILVYFLNATKFDPIAFEWSKSFIKYLQDFESDKVDIAMFTWRATEDGFEDTILVALMFFIGTLVIMVLFTFVTSSSSNGLPWLGILGCLSSILSLISSFGFTVILGYDLIAVAVVVPFLMLGIGMDNTFILLASWRKTDIHDPLDRRMERTMSHAGSSITISSLTTFASFVVGTFVIFPGVKIFCIYIASAMAFTYLYHLTFFGGCLAAVGKLRSTFTTSRCH
ncbi:daf-6 [Cordylochernes scorpioides]|uniref:Daf-6 n=1 Tax=Cordylochernes scorpioides TaxID=51811 RepID=A0ABY6KNQ6_9ARAC|nr:daf-6 [Cordylochernes scorpioides]